MKEEFDTLHEAIVEMLKVQQQACTEVPTVQCSRAAADCLGTESQCVGNAHTPAMFSNWFGCA